MKLQANKNPAFTDEEWLQLLQKDNPAIYRLVVDGFIAIDLTPIKCPRCHHKEFVKKNIDHWEGHACEYDSCCANCGEVNGHWAYGYYIL